MNFLPKNKRAIFFSVLSLVIFTVIFSSSNKALDLVETKIVSASNSYERTAVGVDSEKTLVTKVIDKGVEKAPEFSAGGVLALDLSTQQILFQKNMHKRLSPASTTKIMAAIVASEHFKQADELVVYPEALVGGSTMGLVAYEKLSFRSLLYGMLLNSGNDAAYTIAMNYPGGYSAFIDRMNKKASEMGLVNTHFDNPAGFDSPNHYSSAYDLSKIAAEASRNYQLARIVATKETSVSSLNSFDASGSAKKRHALRNLNKLLSETGVLGFKTGFTEIAGENLVGLVERDGRRVLTVVLNSQNRFGETKNLMDWVYKNFSWESKWE